MVAGSRHAKVAQTQQAQQASIGPYPAWFARDLVRNAAWLPAPVKQKGLDVAYASRLALFPPDIRRNLAMLDIPRWLIALIPTDVPVQDEINKQMRFMTCLAGAPPPNRYARRAEQLVVFAGGAQLPTPGATATGQSLGDAGCAAAISRYVLAQMKLDFPELLGLDGRVVDSQSSAELRSHFEAAQETGFVCVRCIPFDALQRADFKPGSILIAQKPGGNHVMVWTRVPSDWHWDPDDLMAVGNTGLRPFGHRMILAQDYVTSDGNMTGTNPSELKHNAHGPINSHKLGPLSDPKTNIFAEKDSVFFMVDFLDPAAASPAMPTPPEASLPARHDFTTIAFH